MCCGRFAAPDPPPSSGGSRGGTQPRTSPARRRPVEGPDAAVPAQPGRFGLGPVRHRRLLPVRPNSRQRTLQAQLGALATPGRPRFNLKSTATVARPSVRRRRRASRRARRRSGRSGEGRAGLTSCGTKNRGGVSSLDVRPGLTSKLGIATPLPSGAGVWSAADWAGDGRVGARSLPLPNRLSVNRDVGRGMSSVGRLTLSEATADGGSIGPRPSRRWSLHGSHGSRQPT